MLPRKLIMKVRGIRGTIECFLQLMLAMHFMIKQYIFRKPSVFLSFSFQGINVRPTFGTTICILERRCVIFQTCFRMRFARVLAFSITKENDQSSTSYKILSLFHSIYVPIIVSLDQ